MKILTAEKFAEKVMENGTEVEPDEGATMDWQQFEPDETVWMIYAHFNDDGSVVQSRDGADWTLTAKMKLDEEQSEALMQGDLDDMEKEIIISEIYPEYVKIVKEHEDL